MPFRDPQVVQSYKQGKVQVIGFLIGQVMQKTQGKADPQTAQKILKQKLS